MDKISLRLPPFLLDTTLSRDLVRLFPAYPAIPDALIRIDFDWSAVEYFDDLTLLKLVFVQRRMRSQGAVVRNVGLRLVPASSQRQAVVRQLWAVGLPELTASGHLVHPGHLKTVLADDESELLESDPFYHAGTTTAVVPMLFCQEPQHFAPGSREEKQLDAFIAACLRPVDVGAETWDIVESREFRHQILQQLRRNVHEHSRAGAPAAIGLAVARIWTQESLEEEWGLRDEAVKKLRKNWPNNPASRLLSTLSKDRGLLQISIVDDGVGIPATLVGVHEHLVDRSIQQELFPRAQRVRYVDDSFDKRFSDPAGWESPKARLIAFAMDALGTCKPNRAPELKGLQYLRENAAIQMGGSLLVESDGAAVEGIEGQRQFGRPIAPVFSWVDGGGTAVSLFVPMTRVKAGLSPRRPRYAVTSGWSSSPSRGVDRLAIRDLLEPVTRTGREPTPKELARFAERLVASLRSVAQDVETAGSRGQQLVIVDWGELPESKRIFHYLMTGVAKALSQADTQTLRPFVFAGMPKGFCGLLSYAIGEFGRGQVPTPVCVFTAEVPELFWLGLDSRESLPDSLQSGIGRTPRRRLTDQRETRAEAFYRESIAHILSRSVPTSPLDCDGVLRAERSALSQSAAYSRLQLLLRRCSLLREENATSADGERASTGRFYPVYPLDEITGAVRSLFLGRFRQAFTTPPVCFKPSNPRQGVKLPHSGRILARYFRSDALVDSPIAMDLSQELTSIALGIAAQMPNHQINWVISCTSPVHWFVHRIVDGLAENGVICSHHVFASYEDLRSRTENIGIRPGDVVLAFTDVIATAHTAHQMAASLIERYEAKIAGLIALADIRTAADRSEGPDLNSIYGNRVVCLYHEAEEPQDLLPAYYVHPETVVPKKTSSVSPEKEFFENNFSGVGPLTEQHAFFATSRHTLQLMDRLGAVSFGHFQHGGHHSEVYVDVETILAFRDYRNALVSALFRYVVLNEIRLVVYPSHSSAYLLADELRQRCSDQNPPVAFVMACRTFKGSRGTSYAITRFSPEPGPDFEAYAGAAVLILDDAVCSGATVESLIAELARIQRHYYEDQPASQVDASPNLLGPVHVVAFLSRLPRIAGEFWRALDRITSQRIQFSSIVTIPLASDSADTCPQCRFLSLLSHEVQSPTHCFYTREFLAWWMASRSVVYSSERRLQRAAASARSAPQERGHCTFTARDSLRLAGYLSAIERHGYEGISRRLFEQESRPADEESVGVRALVRSRAAFLEGLIPPGPGSEGTRLAAELSSLLEILVTDSGQVGSEESLLEVLISLCSRYVTRRPHPGEIEAVFACLVGKLASALHSRLVMGGITCVLDLGFKWADGEELTKLRQALGQRLEDLSSRELSPKTRLFLNWLEIYLARDRRRIGSVGDAVRILAQAAKKGPQYHFYRGHELDALRAECGRAPDTANANQSQDVVPRTLACTEVLASLLDATRVLQSTSAVEEKELTSLQEVTEAGIRELRSRCRTALGTERTGDPVQDYREIKALYARVYDLWFAEEPPILPARIIRHYTPNLRVSVLAAWGAMRSDSCFGSQIVADLAGLDSHGPLRVVVDPTVLATALTQVFHNLKKHAEGDSRVDATCEIQLTTDHHGLPDSPRTRADRVDLTFSNTGTRRPASKQVVLDGLAEVQARLAEYGGDFRYNTRSTTWSFQATLVLPIWTEKT